MSRLLAFEATSVVIVAVMRFVGGWFRFMTPKVNCVIFESEPVGVMLVAAVALAAMSVSSDDEQHGQGAEIPADAEPRVGHDDAGSADDGNADPGDAQGNFDVAEHIRTLRLFPQEPGERRDDDLGL